MTPPMISLPLSMTGLKTARTRWPKLMQQLNAWNFRMTAPMNLFVP